MNDNETKCISLSEILTHEQISRLTVFINKLNEEGLDCMSPEFAKRMKGFFWEMGEELQKKGIFPDYLAYAVIAHICERKQIAHVCERKQNRSDIDESKKKSNI